MRVSGLRVCAHGVPHESQQSLILGIQNTMSSGSVISPKTTETPAKSLLVDWISGCGESFLSMVQSVGDLALFSAATFAALFKGASDVLWTHGFVSHDGWMGGC